MQGVYVIAYENGLYKIGMSINIRERFSTLLGASPVPAELIMGVKTSDPRGLEAYLHDRYQDNCEHREFFGLTDDQYSDLVDAEWVSEYGGEVEIVRDFDELKERATGGGSIDTFYWPDRSRREEVNEIARKLGYIAERGPNAGGGHLGKMLQAIASGELVVLDRREYEWLKRSKGKGARDSLPA